jgi:integrase
MTTFKRGRIYWFNFWWQDQHIQESTHQGNLRVAGKMEAAHRTRLALAEVGLEPPPEVSTLGEFITKEFFPWVETTFVAKQKTLKWYKGEAKHLLGFARLNDTRLDQITGDEIRAYVAQRQGERRTRLERIPPAEQGKKRFRRVERPFTITTINRELQVLRRILHLAQEWGRVPKVAKVKMLPGEGRRERVLTAEEETKYFQHAVEPLRSVALVLLDSGLRPEECFRLRWEFLNFTDGRYGTMLVPHGKTPAARRLVPMSARVRQMLELRWNAEAKPSAGWVFTAPTESGHVEPSTIRGLHRKAIEAGGLPPFVLYTLRHTFLTRLGESGCDPWTLARVAGHSSITISARYVHPSDEAVQKAFRKMKGGKGLLKAV